MTVRNTSRFAVWRGLILAVVAVAAGEAFLAWQYHRLERLRLPQIEAALEEQRASMEEGRARDALASFYALRLEGRDERALRFLTEEAVLQSEEGAFFFGGAWDDFLILAGERQDGGEFLFQVELTGEGGRLRAVEIVRVRSILGSYYVDSIERAG